MEDALSGWNDKLAEIWTLLTQTPETFKGGDIWNAILGIHNALVGVGYGLLVLFFAIGIFQSAASFRDFQRPEFALRHFIRFILAKLAVGSCMELMTAIFAICGGVVNTVMGSVGGSISTAATLPTEIVTAVESLGLLESIPLWLVSLLSSLFITIMSFILLLRCQRKSIFEKLYRCVYGGRSSGSGLPDLFGVPVQLHTSGRRIPFRCEYGMAICRTAHFQYAYPHRTCQRRGSNCKGNAGSIT